MQVGGWLHYLLVVCAIQQRFCSDVVWAHQWTVTRGSTGPEVSSLTENLCFHLYSRHICSVLWQ